MKEKTEVGKHWDKAYLTLSIRFHLNFRYVHSEEPYDDSIMGRRPDRATASLVLRRLRAGEQYRGIPHQARTNTVERSRD